MISWIYFDERAISSDIMAFSSDEIFVVFKNESCRMENEPKIYNDRPDDNRSKITILNGSLLPAFSQRNITALTKPAEKPLKELNCSFPNFQRVSTWKRTFCGSWML